VGLVRRRKMLREDQRMTGEEVGLWIQGASVVVAVGASVVALVVGGVDRRAAERNAERDREAARRLAENERREAAQHARRMLDFEALLRLAENQRRGGSSDAETRSELGAEAAVLTAMIGPERLPRLSQALNPESEAELRDFMDAPGTVEWQKRAAEAHLALLQITREIREAS